MPTPPDPRKTPPIRRFVIIIAIVAVIWGIIFVGYNIHHAKRMSENGGSGQVSPDGTTTATR